MNPAPVPPNKNTVLEEAWTQVVGGMDWLLSVIIGEFADKRSLSAIVADMLIGFVPGVVIVTSARDAVAVILRLASHPEKREELMEWVLLSACLIVVALPLAMAAGGAVGAGASAVIGGIAGSELGAALRAVMLLLIKETSKLTELVRFLQKFMHGDVLKFLRAIKFAKYEKTLAQGLSKIIGKLVEIVRSLRTHLENIQYFDSVKATIVQLTEWEKKFYDVQHDAIKQLPKALTELDLRLGKVLTETSAKEKHSPTAGIQADHTLALAPVKQRIRDTPGEILNKLDNQSQKKINRHRTSLTKKFPRKKYHLQMEIPIQSKNLMKSKIQKNRKLLTQPYQQIDHVLPSYPMPGKLTKHEKFCSLM